MNKETNEYREWFGRAWRESGGLISSMTAATLLGKSKSAISRQLGKKYKVWQWKSMKFLSLNEIYSIISIEKDKKINDNNKETDI